MGVAFGAGDASCLAGGRLLRQGHLNAVLCDVSGAFGGATLLPALWVVCFRIDECE